MTIFLFITLLLGLILRIIGLNQSLWLDEAIGAIVAKTLGYREILTRFVVADNHPPLYYLSLKAWSQMFGYSEIALRSLSVLFGLGTVVIVFFIAKELFKKDKWTIIISCLFLATSQFHIYYSQEARMYVMAGFFASLAVLSFLKTLHHKVNMAWWVVFSISLPLMMFSDYMPVFLLPVFWIYPLIIKKDKSWWIKLVMAHLPLGILGLYWLPTFLIQSQNGKWLIANLPLWKSVAGGATLKQLGLVWVKFIFGRISFNNKAIYYSLIAIISLPLAFIFARALHFWRKLSFVWLWLIVPIFLGFIASIWFPAFIYFRYIFVLPAFYLLLAYGTTSLKNIYLKYFFTVLVLTVSLVSWTIYAVVPDQQRENWKKAVATVESRLKSGEAVAVENPDAFTPFKWYSKTNKKEIDLVPKIGAKDSEIRAQANTQIEKLKGIYLFEYLKDLNDPNGIARYIIEQSGFIKKDTLGGFGGVGNIDYFVRP
jgi:uncharacterized membrane protein